MKFGKSMVWPILGLVMALVLAALVPLLGRSREVPLTREIFAMDTVMNLTLYGATEADMTAAVNLIHAEEQMFSRQIPESPLSAVNRSAGGEPLAVPAELAKLIDDTLAWSKRTEGALDPAIGPVVDLWGIGTNHPRVPSPAEIRRALSLCGWYDVIRDGDRVGLAKAGESIDLGAIVKGYCADRLRELLQKRGVKAGVLDLGGNVLAFGAKPGGGPWRIGVQDPQEPRGDILGVVTLPDGGSVVTSGPYERFFEKDGHRYHHIFDPATGRPSDSGLAAVTVISRNSEEGDALSTALFVLGLDRGSALVGSLSGIEVLFVGDGWVKRVGSGPATFSLREGGGYEVR